MFKQIWDIGKSILNITVEIEKNEFIIFFENDIYIRIYPNNILETSEDMINFFMDNEHVLCYSSLKKFYWEK